MAPPAKKPQSTPRSAHCYRRWAREKAGKPWWQRPPPEYIWDEKKNKRKKKNTRGTRSWRKKQERIERGQKRRLEHPHGAGDERAAPPAAPGPAQDDEPPDDDSSESSLDTAPVVLQETTQPAGAPEAPADVATEAGNTGKDLKKEMARTLTRTRRKKRRGRTGHTVQECLYNSKGKGKGQQKGGVHAVAEDTALQLSAGPSASVAVSTATTAKPGAQHISEEKVRVLAVSEERRGYLLVDTGATVSVCALKPSSAKVRQTL